MAPNQDPFACWQSHWPAVATLGFRSCSTHDDQMASRCSAVGDLPGADSPPSLVGDDDHILQTL